MIDLVTRVSDTGLLPSTVSAEIREGLAALKGKLAWIRIQSMATRTIQQNRYLHLLFTIASNELIRITGDSSLTKDAVKSMAKFKYLKFDVVNPRTGEIVAQRLGETSKLSKEDCYEFTTKFIGWMADEFGVHLPLPNEQQEMGY